MVRAALLVISLAACSTHEVRYVPMQCPEIPRPELPEVSEEAMTCLADDTYFDIKERDQLRKQYAERYEEVCKTFEDLADEADG